MFCQSIVKHSVHTVAAALLCIAPQVQASEFASQRAQESLQLAPLDATVVSTLGDGQRSFGYAHTQSFFDAADVDRIDLQTVTDLSFSQQFSGATVHLSGQSSPWKSQFGAGVSLHRTSFYFGSGKDTGLSWSQSALPGVSDVFKSGFRSAESRWSDASLAQSFDNGLQLRGGRARIDLKDRVNPDLFHAGLSWNGFSADYAATRRNGVTVGQGLSMQLRKGRFAVGYEEIRDINNHSLRAVRTSFANRTNRRMGFSLEAGVSPFTGVNDQRFMLSYSGKIGRPLRLATNEKAADRKTGGARDGKKGDDVVVQQKSYKKQLIIAASILGGAVALASSSGNADSQQGGFESQHRAARDILNVVNPKSVRENREYGGWIVKSGDNTYTHTSPVTGNIDSVSLGSKPGNATATYHTHGAADPRYDNEHFSPQDTLSDDIFDVDGYLGTPAGAFLYYNHRSGNVSRLGTIAN